MANDNDENIAVVSIQPSMIVPYAVSIALSEAVAAGTITKEISLGIQARADEVIELLTLGYTLTIQDDGTYKARQREDEDAPLVIGD